MPDNCMEFTSLCLVTTDYSGQAWVNRLADIEEDRIVEVRFQEDQPHIFENRDRFYHSNGPDYQDAIGIWKWDAIPSRTNFTRDSVKSYYQSAGNPIRVIPLANVTSDEQLISMLREGITEHYYDCDTLFVYRQKALFYHGVLCKKNEFREDGENIKLCENVYTLPIFDIPRTNVVHTKKHICFLNTFSVGKSHDFIVIGDVSKVIREIILARMTWPIYKESIGGSKKEWQRCRKIFDLACNESLYEVVERTLKCSTGQAKLLVKEFTEHVGTHIDAGDFDSDVLAEIVLHHENLKAQCEASVEEKWKAEHKTEIDAAAAEVEVVRKTAERDCAAVRKNLQELEQQVQTAEQNKTAVLAELSAAQEKLDGLLAEIEQYEALGKDTLKAVRSKIAEAQKDMAGFIAELSVVLPQPQVQQEPVKQENKRLPVVWRYDAALDYEFDDDEIEISVSWKEEYAQLCDNLSRSLGIDGILCDMLAAFLYAANHQNEPLLIAGPGGREIGNAFSGSMFAARSGHLTLENEFNSDLFDTTRKFSEKVITIHNMFHKGWSATLLQDFARSEKQILWSHPYVEDLTIEPKELYSYALPLLSECFVVDLPQNRHPFVNPNIYAKRAGNFKAYRSGKKKPLRLTAWKRLKLSKMVLNRMERILSDVKQIMDQESYAKDIEILLGILPMAVLTGKREILKDLLEEEKNISREVRAEVERYIEGE